MKKTLLILLFLGQLHFSFSQQYFGVEVPQDFFEVPMEYKLWFLLSRNQPELVLSIMDTLQDENIYYPMYKACANYKLSNFEKSESILIDYLSNPDTISNKGKDAASLCYSYLGLIKLNQKDTVNAISNLKRGVDLAPDRYDLEFASFELAKLNNNYGTSKIISQMNIGYDAPDFELEDEKGLKYRLSEFKGKPIVLHFGTTWCGSCQQDAVALELFANKYSEYCHFIKILSGENHLTGIDYKNHYKSKLLALYDYDEKISKLYNNNSLATAILIDTLGVIQFNESDVFYDDNYKMLIKSAIKKLYGENELAANSDKYVCDRTKCYVPNLAKRDSLINEFGADYTIDSKGHNWIIFASNVRGNNNIYLRRYKKNKLINEYQITQNLNNNYNPDIAITSDDKIYITWISNSNGLYNVYLKQYNKGVFSEPKQVTNLLNDAFHPQILCDSKDNLHLTYYVWDSIDGYSRDRNVFYTNFSSGEWLAAMEVNPEKPIIDDHTDPAIAIDSKGIVWIVWSYDYHRNEYVNPIKSYSTSIFGQRIKVGIKIDSCIFIGTSENKIKYCTDIYPKIAVDKSDKIWCVWETTANQSKKIMCKKIGSEVEYLISNPDFIAVTPDITIDNENIPIVVWSQRDKEKWNIYSSKYKGGLWSAPIILTENDKNSKEPKLIIDLKNEKYLLFTEYENGNSKTRIKKIVR